MPNRSPLQDLLYRTGRELRRLANIRDLTHDDIQSSLRFMSGYAAGPFDGPICPPPDGVAPRNSGPPYDDGHGHLLADPECDSAEGLYFNPNCQYSIGTEITRDHPIYADAPPPHDPSHDSRPLARAIPWSPSEVDGGVIETVAAAKKYFPDTNNDLLPAHRRSWIGQATPQALNNAGTTISKAAFLELLPHIPFAKARYVATATPTTPKFECLDYADAFKAFAVAIGIYPTGFVLDFKGGHSYNTVLVFNEFAREYELLVVEPQGNVVVPRAYPAHHYTGSGVVLYY